MLTKGIMVSRIDYETIFQWEMKITSRRPLNTAYQCKWIGPNFYISEKM